MTIIVALYEGDDIIGLNYNTDSYTYFSTLPLQGVTWCRYTDDTNSSYTTKLDMSGTVAHIYDNAYADGFLNIGCDASNNVLATHVNGAVKEVRRVVDNSTPDYVTTTVLMGDTFVLDSGGNMWSIQSPSTPVRLSSFNFGAHTVTQSPTSGTDAYRFLRNGGGIAGRMYFCTISSGTPTGVAYANISTLAITSVLSIAFDQFQVAPPVIGSDGNIYVAFGGVLTKYDQDGSSISNVSISTTGDLNVWLYDDTGMLWVRGDDPSDDWKIVNASTMTVVDTVAVDGFTDLIGEPFSGRPAFWGFFSGTTDGTIGILQATALGKLIPIVVNT